MSQKEKDNVVVKNLAGLVLCGGLSKRMGSDKSKIVYHELPQRYHLYNMLELFCEKVFISCNEEQVIEIKKKYAYIADDIFFGKIGPMAGLLSAFTLHPDKNIILIGCDYPLMDVDDLSPFLKLCNGDTPIAFYNKEGNVYEPVIAYYPNKIYNKLKELFQSGQYSLQYLLRSTNAIKYFPENEKCLTVVNTQAEYKNVIEFMQGL